MRFEKLWIWLAWRLPRRLVYWAVIRAGAIASTGIWSGQEYPAEVPVSEVLRRVNIRSA